MPSEQDRTRVRRLVDPLYFRFREAQSRRKLQTVVIWFVIPTYVFSVLATFALIFLEALSVTSLPEKVLAWLGPAVIGEFVSTVGVIAVYLFREHLGE